MEPSIYSLIPPLLAILMVILTKRVLLSLGTGIIVGAFMLKSFDVVSSISFVYTTVRDIFVMQNDAGQWTLNKWNVYILLFLILLGIMTSLISMAGGTRAFGEWAMRRVKTRVGAQILTIIFGIIIFIDDYFNSLAVGNVSRPLTDRHRISRAKLAYYIDSTAAPVCVISPVSSWGAYIIGIIGTILATHQITEYGAFEAFMAMVPMNFYALFAILLVFATALFGVNFKAMKSFETKAVTTGEVVDTSKGGIPGQQLDMPESDKGKIGDLIWPIVVLIIGTVGAMILTGITVVRTAGGEITLLTIFENTKVAESLLFGALIGLVATCVVFIPKGFSFKSFGLGVWRGTQSMLPAIYILIFAWTINTIIGELGTGAYLAHLVEQMNIALGFLPAILFVISALMAFATGTSWGTFGIMMPIAGQIAASTDPTYMLPVLAAVLAGAVMGDHCSPISDTTILSSTGAGCNHIDHVMTQLPYALLAAGVSTIGYLVLGFTGSTVLGFVAAFVVFAVTIWIMSKTKRSQLSTAKEQMDH